MLKFFLELRTWHYAKIDAIENISEFIISSFSNDVLTTSDETLKTFLCIWREACFFSTVQNIQEINSNNINDKKQADICQKQAIYVKTNLNLMLKSTMDNEARQRFYKELLTKINQLIISPSKFSY